MRFFKNFVPLVLAVLVALGGCEDLAVENQNNPDRERALTQPGDIETLIQGTFRTYYYSQENFEPSFALSVAADEQSSSWGNFGMQDMGSEPREPYNNDPSYTYSDVAEVPFTNSYSAVSAALDGIAVIEDGMIIGDEAQTQRAKAFAEMVAGLAHANVAVNFDQGFVVDNVPEVEGTFDPDDAPFEIVDYQTVWEDGALPFLNSAISTAENSTFSSIPSGWMGATEFSREEFIAIVKMYRAHYRAAMARNPQERQSVAWQQVIDDIDEGYTEVTDEVFKINDPQENWFSGFRYYGKDFIWTRADYKTVGPADESGNYQDWLDSDLSERFPFDITTDDRRITGDGDEETPQEEAEGKYFYYAGASFFPSDRGIYHYSNYAYSRNDDTRYNYAGGNEKWIITPETMRLLKAEALLHLDPVGNKNEVVDLINESRVQIGELEPALPIDDTGSMSDPQNPNRNDGATVWSMLKHEKRMESFATISGLAFYDKRGWGDLVTGTPFHLPIPGSELQLLEEAIYTTETVGNSGKVYNRH